MKKMKVQEFNQAYMLINEIETTFIYEYPEKDQFKYIVDKVSHVDVKEYNVKYSSDLALINMGEIGKYRIDGVPFGFYAFIITIEME